MRINKRIMLLGLVLSPLVLNSCNLVTTPVIRGKITVWVDQNSVDFYKAEATKFLELNKDIPYNIEIKGADTGSAGGALSQDNASCADIVTIAHDNIGKLSARKYIQPITDTTLLTQIDTDNPIVYKNVIVSKYGQTSDAGEYTFGAPYISQALFLYYNKRFVTPEQAKTFEGLEEAGLKANAKAFTVTGTDTFNFSFGILARRERDKFTTTKIYENLDLNNAFFQGNDAIAVSRWMQEEFSKPNGLMLPTSSGWAVDMRGDNPSVLSMIGGYWHLNGLKQSIGEENIGCALIPTFKLKAKHVEGLQANELDSNVPVAGDEYRGGTFTDCKVFVINSAAEQEKLPYINRIITYFSSKEVQNKSLLANGVVPAYKGAQEFVNLHKEEIGTLNAEMVTAQLGMQNYGIAQPFMLGIMNTYYYSKGCDYIIRDMIINDENVYGSLRKVQECHYSIEHIWKHGNSPTQFPRDLPTLA